MVGRAVVVSVGVRVGGGGETPGSSVGGTSVGAGVLMANRSRVGMRVTVGCGVSVGTGVAGVRKDRSEGNAEHPVRMIARRMMTVFFAGVLCMDSSKVVMDNFINCILFDGDFYAI